MTEARPVGGASARVIGSGGLPTGPEPDERLALRVVERLDVVAGRVLRTLALDDGERLARGGRPPDVEPAQRGVGEFAAGLEELLADERVAAAHRGGRLGVAEHMAEHIGQEGGQSLRLLLTIDVAAADQPGPAS